MTTQAGATTWDAIVVGGGAAGLSAALMLGRARRRALVIDAGRPRNRFAAHMHGVLGHEGTPPSELVRAGRDEVAGYGIEVLDADVERVLDAGDHLTAILADGRTEQARALVLATGITDELPDVPGLAQGWGTSVLHCPYCHGWEVRDQRLGVLATSPMSLHQARLVRQWSDHVVLFSDAIGVLGPDEERRLRARGIDIVTAPVIEVLGDGERVRGVRTADGGTIEVEAIFTAGVPRPHDHAVADLELARAEQPFGLGSFIDVDPTGRTSHARVWAVGNVVNPMANVPLAIGAGSLAGAGVNGALVEEEFDLALR